MVDKDLEIDNGFDRLGDPPQPVCASVKNL